MVSLIEELSAYEKVLIEHIRTLEAYASAVKEHDLAVFPRLEGDRAVLDVFNFRATNGSGRIVVTDAPAAFFYEAYCEYRAKIFARAIERARAATAAKVQELRARTANARERLDASEKELEDFFNGAPPPGAQRAAPKRRKRKTK